MRRRGVEGGEGGQAAVGGGRAAHADDHPGGAGVEGGRDQLAGAPRRRPQGVVALGPAQQVEARRPGHLHHRGAVGLHPPLGVDQLAEGPVDGRVAGRRRPGPPACPRRRRPPGPGRTPTRPARRRGRWPPPPGPRWPFPGTCRARRPAWGPFPRGYRGAWATPTRRSSSFPTGARSPSPATTTASWSPAGAAGAWCRASGRWCATSGPRGSRRP